MFAIQILFRNTNPLKRIPEESRSELFFGIVGQETEKLFSFHVQIKLICSERVLSIVVEYRFNICYC